MTGLTRRLVTPAPRAVVAAYLFDLANAPEWDVHTTSCVRVDGGAQLFGAHYERRCDYGGRRVQVPTEVTEHDEERAITWSVRMRFGTMTERIELTDEDGRTVVTHGVEVQLRGPARLVGQPMVPAVMRRIADDGTPRLQRRLDGLAER